MNRMNLPDRFRDENWATDLLAKSEYAFVSVNGEDGFPYSVPLCLVGVGDEFYFHTAPRGLAVDLFRRDGRACVSCAPYARRDPGNTTMRYRSAMAFGDIGEVTDPDEKASAMLRFFEKYIPGDARSEALSRRAANHAAVWRITIRTITGKESARE
jgi:nitroimidazol reductase NimA-like FMN-containing flavoprotein (pyridoxamine 5'-phosphate oxidase superfamily)